MCRTIPTLSIFYFFINKRFARTPNALGNTFRHVAKASNPSGNDFRRARKCQTFRETTFAMRGNAKPFGKRLSPCAEMPNPSGNDFRHARKCQTFRKMTFAMRGNAKPFGKRLLTELFERCCHITIYAAIIICFLYLILIKLYTMSKTWKWPIH